MAREINILRVAGNWQAIRGYRKNVKQWCMIALENTKFTSVSVVLADDQFIRTLNHQYRGKNKPTNVLSFTGEGGELGDVVLAFDTVRREAEEQGKSLAAHTAHLVVHGLLHLLGFDHENDKDAAKMEKREIAILAKLGFANPYEFCEVVT